MDDRLSEGVELTWTRDARVRSAEGHALRVLRRPAEQLLGLPLGEALGLTPEAVDQLSARAYEGDRGPHFVRAHFDDHATVLRVTTVRVEEEVNALVLDLEGLLNGAPPLQISKLSSSLSHELRNPLSSVKMAVQTLQRNASHLGERDQRRLMIANKEIRTMERMLWLFSEYGRESPPHVEPMSLRALVKEAAGLIDPELNDRKTEVEIHEAPDLPPVKVDLARIRPVLAQLLLNVAMGQPDGGKLPVRLVADPLGAAMVVEDLEAALPQSETENLFEPFGSRLARGAGLSLAALRRVMQGLGGEVLASGSERPGIVFTLRFPS